MLTSGRYCSGGSCSDLVSMLNSPSYNRATCHFAHLDEAGRIPRGIHCNYRTRTSEGSRISAYRRETSSGHQRSALSLIEPRASLKNTLYSREHPPFRWRGSQACGFRCLWSTIGHFVCQEEHLRWNALLDVSRSYKTEWL